MIISAFETFYLNDKRLISGLALIGKGVVGNDIMDITTIGLI